MRGLDKFLEKLRKKKPPEKEEIPPGYVRCSRCQRLVKEEKTLLSLPEGWVVCEECFFGCAE